MSIMSGHQWRCLVWNQFTLLHLWVNQNICNYSTNEWIKSMLNNVKACFILHYKWYQNLRYNEPTGGAAEAYKGGKRLDRLRQNKIYFIFRQKNSFLVSFTGRQMFYMVWFFKHQFHLRFAELKSKVMSSPINPLKQRWRHRTENVKALLICVCEVSSCDTEDPQGLCL